MTEGIVLFFSSWLSIYSYWNAENSLIMFGSGGRMNFFPEASISGAFQLFLI
jgi:hypothetical protein